MKKELFEELLESVKQGGAIMKGAMKPSRSIEFPFRDVFPAPWGVYFFCERV